MYSFLEDIDSAIQEPVGASATYVPYVIYDNTVIISGQLPFYNGSIDTQIGKLGEDTELYQGYNIAMLCCLNLLAHLRKACDGDLSKVKKCLKIEVFVNSSSDFTDHSLVANGASDLLIKYFGLEVGSHSRVAVGVNSLPFGVAVEVSGSFLLK